MEFELKLSKKDLEELEEEKKKFFQERIDFHNAHLEWLKENPDKKPKEIDRTKLPKMMRMALEIQEIGNFEQRMEFITMYTEWLKKTPNKVWSKQQNKLLNK
ncbi:MAG: hypothetical protein Q7S21_01800 [archaeon]|nr:hypothetical protein [archaeon]